MITEDALKIEKLETQNQTIAVTATFTAEPVEESLAFWMQELELPFQVEFAPYNQVFQQLLDPGSLLNQNKNGINVVLVRLEDWQRVDEHQQANVEDGNSAEKINRNANDLVMALKSAVSRSKTPHVVVFCPASPSILTSRAQKELFQETEAAIISELSDVSGLYFLTEKDLAAYPVDKYYDPQSDKLGHIPFTPVYFTALGSAIARKIYAIKSSPHKVIVLDCDNTLWKGVVGEDGVMGIEISSDWQALQQLMVEQQTAGMLICLCSKNNEVDVLEVFEKRQDMPLKREHIVSWRINWMPKSENIKSLAQERNLGLDSFIFIDDNPVECAEVQASCPEVLTLQLPSENIPEFLNHIWAFDRLKVTAEDKQRTELYKQNLERDRFAKDALTIGDFLAGLKLKIDISDPDASNLPRVSQLTQRTNQFNFTTIRRSETEMQQLLQSGYECRIVEVSDRFGDYGLVGVIIFAKNQDAIEVDTFLLSCRVLGRGVEHRMVTQLAEIAKERGLDRINIKYVTTQKNLPALNFLNSVADEFKQTTDNGYFFSLPVEFAAAISYTPGGDKPTPEVSEVKAAVATNSATIKTPKSALLGRIANELNDSEKILQIIESQQRQSPQKQQSLLAPSTETEQKLAEIWAKLLRRDRVGIQDDFFDLGGSSLLGVSLFAQIENIFGKNLPLATLLQAPTIEKLAKVIDREDETVTWSPLVALQPKGNKPPLFCPHAAGGNVLIYRNLAPYLGETQPLYGLQPKGLDGKEAPLTRFEDIADYYLEAMRTIQPKGPYYLAGLSSGGKVAMGIAQKLIEQGEKVALLAMFDTYGPGYPKMMGATSVAGYIKIRFRQIFDNHWNNLLLLEPKQKLDYVKEKIRIIPQETMKMIREYYWRTGKKLPPALQKVQEANRKAEKSYAPKEYAGKLTLFRAEKQPLGCAPDPYLGWETRIKGGIEIHDVPGYHAGVIKEPHIRTLGPKLKACLEKAQAEAEVSN